MDNLINQDYIPKNVNNPFLHVENNGQYVNWNDIKSKVIKICEEQIKQETNNEIFIKLAIALAYYDFHGAPSNWWPDLQEEYGHHEKIILGWTEWAIKNVKKNKINKIIKEYENQYVPDCFDLLINYFC